MKNWQDKGLGQGVVNGEKVSRLVLLGLFADSSGA